MAGSDILPTHAWLPTETLHADHHQLEEPSVNFHPIRLMKNTAINEMVGESLMKRISKSHQREDFSQIFDPNDGNPCIFEGCFRGGATRIEANKTAFFNVHGEIHLRIAY